MAIKFFVSESLIMIFYVLQNKNHQCPFVDAIILSEYANSKADKRNTR